MHAQPNNPLHGITLENVVTQLVDHYGWRELAQIVKINCFRSDPSIKSSLKFLRKTQWARDEVEDLYITTFTDSIPKPRSLSAKNELEAQAVTPKKGHKKSSAASHSKSKIKADPWANFKG
ncbi:VF530 family DNA-binding protein [Algibacillus agarilyticus]|uniref:VF530 family protein n=1 Tax=Algibacillus agarilyticus TaxID=2234133 RepID=UPI000DCF6474|nr:VF530 family protein [Algibacillus agarilyticus]